MAKKIYIYPFERKCINMLYHHYAEGSLPKRAAANRFAAQRSPGSAAAKAGGAGAVVQRYFKDGEDAMTDDQVKLKIKEAGLNEAGEKYIMQLHARASAYILSKSISVAISVYGTLEGKSPALGTYGSVKPIKSSEARHARRVMKEDGGTRNFANQKLKHRKTGEIIYLGSLSMGLGVPQMELPNETATVSGGVKRKRSHSEALLTAAHRAGKIKDDKGKVTDLSEYEPVYVFSTNEFCQNAKGHQDCHGHLAAGLTKDKTVPAYVANAYSGSDDAGVFKSSLGLHNRLKKSTKTDYDSEPDSEDDSEVPLYLVDDQKLRGQTVAVGDEVDVVRQPPHKRRKLK